MVLARWFKSGTWPIGCAMGEKVVRLAQLRPAGGGGFSIVRSSAPIQMPEVQAGSAGQGEPREAWRAAAAAAMKQAFTGAGFTGCQTVSCLPPMQMHYRHLRLAPMPDGELASAVQHRAARELDGKVERVRAEYFDVGQVVESGKRRREVVAVAAAGADVDAHVAMLEAVGLHPIAIDAEPAALARCLLNGQGGACGDDDATASSAVEQTRGAGAARLPLTSHGTAPTLIIDLAASSANLTIACEGMPRFIRSLPGGRMRILELTGDRVELDAHRQAMLMATLEGECPTGSLMGTAESDASLDQQAGEALQEAAVLYASELSHGVSLCLHYLNQARLTAFQARRGCIVGGGTLQDALVQALDRASNIEFHPVGDLLSPMVADLASSEGGDGISDVWLLPVGLALYGHEHLLAAQPEVAA